MPRCDSYDLGECTWGVCELVPWLPEGLGNATDWAADGARAGLELSAEPRVGAVVVYAGGGGYSEFGHVALVTEVYSSDAFRVREMNFVSWDQYDERVSSRFDVEAFLLAPGTLGLGGGAAESGGGGIGQADVEFWWGATVGVLTDTLPALRQQLTGFSGVLKGF